MTKIIHTTLTLLDDMVNVVGCTFHKLFIRCVVVRKIRPEPSIKVKIKHGQMLFWDCAVYFYQFTEIHGLAQVFDIIYGAID